jgi:hypothetical protein
MGGNALQNRCSTTELTRRLDERSGSYTYPALERSRNRWTADLVPLACAAVSGSANARSVPRKPGMSTSTGLRHMVYLGRCLHTAETFAGADNARGGWQETWRRQSPRSLLTAYRPPNAHPPLTAQPPAEAAAAADPAALDPRAAASLSARPLSPIPDRDRVGSAAETRS